jgi:hypothetical protein
MKYKFSEQKDRDACVQRGGLAQAAVQPRRNGSAILQVSFPLVPQ